MLGLEYIDLMLVHWPCETDEQTLKTYKALEPMVKDGSARAIGVFERNMQLRSELSADSRPPLS